MVCPTPVCTEVPIHSRNPHGLLQLVVEGRSSAQIAEVLHLSPKTVETYRSNLMKKLEIQTLPELVKFAIKYAVASWNKPMPSIKVSP